MRWSVSLVTSGSLWKPCIWMSFIQQNVIAFDKLCFVLVAAAMQTCLKKPKGKGSSRLITCSWQTTTSQKGSHSTIVSERYVYVYHIYGICNISFEGDGVSQRIGICLTSLEPSFSAMNETKVLWDRTFCFRLLSDASKITCCMILIGFLWLKSCISMEQTGAWMSSSYVVIDDFLAWNNRNNIWSKLNRFKLSKIQYAFLSESSILVVCHQVNVNKTAWAHGLDTSILSHSNLSSLTSQLQKIMGFYSEIPSTHTYSTVTPVRHGLWFVS